MDPPDTLASQDFFYVCPSHLKQSTFCKPIIDHAAVEAKKKKALEDEVERVKKEYEEKQRKKKEKEDAETSKDKDKGEKEKEKSKEADEKTDDNPKSDAAADEKVQLRPRHLFRPSL